MINLQARLVELEQQEAHILMQLDEIRHLITGYKNAIKAQAEEKTEEATEE